jgi:uncharacterized protein YbbK (DUF523 family)
MIKKKQSNLQAEIPLLKSRLPIMTSACLLGTHCRYDGQHSFCSNLLDFVSFIPIIPFCPEQLGGLPTPRPCSDIRGGDGRDVLSGNAKIINLAGKDVTDAFIKGAEETVKLARIAGAKIAIMKDKSPSCGLRTPYCEKLSGIGIGVTAALFESREIKMIELGSNDTFPTQDFFEIMRGI